MEVSIRLILLMVLIAVGRGEGQLVENFYSKTCPNVEAIVKQAVFTKFSKANATRQATLQATLRLFFHDCFIEGCDASIMIASANNNAEKDAGENLSLAGDGFDAVIKAKQAVEGACPGIVSCADILAIAARDAVVLAGGPSFSVELGRRDGLISNKSRVHHNIPDPSFNLSQLTTLFARKNLSQFDMIALSGAHSVGVSNCSRFHSRLYPVVDPSLNLNYAKQLMATCSKKIGNPQVFVNLDPETPKVLDNVYYQNLVAGKGLLTSDEVLYTDPESQPTVKDFASNPGHFNAAFIAAIKKLGRVGVKTGNLGEIRRDCAAFNNED
ncbi:peroxidase 55 [Pistacia vera]|uniref:peroxidase 55 n=1 Tax=Pistacia vera TaxID=55513 RepID=UPI001263B42A|nr:peroxidase 55 [Pistacia vera]